ncbi:TadE/TadG family type IV pilus assembly protein [Schlesneria paludicola]|uniref:TadE/TadG family type IV pilus assembly protein n=1 Tax=Schlesneria paludicola TaxID=360056 RepID=UPI000A30C5E2|nr:TadE/TadG family type IV pilus assembly protein [Schlesneria paludicola]
MYQRTPVGGPNRRGAAAVEMALVTPFFVMLVFGIIEFGRAMMVCNLITNAAREGTRAAVLDGSTNAAVTQSVQTFLVGALGVSASDISVAIAVTPATGNPSPGNVIANCLPRDSITVTVQVPYNRVALIPGNYLQSKQLIGQNTMRHE